MNPITAMDTHNQSWRLLYIYNIYRLFTVIFFGCIYYLKLVNVVFSVFYFTVLGVYFSFILAFIYIGWAKKINYEKQVLLSGIIDVVALSCLLNLFVQNEFGSGVILNVTIGVLGVLAPGRLTIFFAALASFLLLLGNALSYELSKESDLLVFYYSGVYGAGFFATALTAWYLSNLVRAQEAIARQHSKELIQMQQLNEYIVSRLHSGIIYIDEHKKIRLMNSAAKMFFNVDAKATPVLLSMLSPSLAKKCNAFLSRSRKKANMAQSILEEPFLRVHFMKTDLPAFKASVLIVLEDMIYISQQAQQLKLAALGHLSASIAHELRNPLGAVAHAAQLLGGGSALDHEEEHLRKLIMSNCERMNAVIKNVLQLSRRESSNAEVMEINAFLTQFRQTFCQNSPCNLKIKVPKKKLYMTFDKSQLEQVLVILCENALNHGADEQGNASIEIEAHSLANRVVLDIRDCGKGIPPELKDKIFEPFFTTVRHSTGMGLFIAKDLCEINESRLSFEVHENGCTFSIIQQSLEDILL